MWSGGRSWLVLLRRQVVDPWFRGRACDARLDQRQAHHQFEDVVGGDAVVPLEPATQTAMHDNVLPVASQERADRRHPPAAPARTVAGNAPVDMPGVQTVRTVVAVAASHDSGVDHRFAVTAAERLLEVTPTRAPGGFVVLVVA
jgi:hypothetical protein